MENNTNSAYFFDNNLKAFQTLISEIIPSVAEVFGEDVNFKVWNPTALTGQQPYSVVMGADSKLRRDIYQKFEVYASSENPEHISKTKDGVYTGMEVQKGLPIKLLLKYFEQLPDKNWKVIEKISTKVKVESFNMSADKAKENEYHLIVCPDFLSGDEASDAVISNLESSLKPGGAIFTIKESDKLSPDKWDKKESNGIFWYCLK